MHASQLLAIFAAAASFVAAAPATTEAPEKIEAGGTIQIGLDEAVLYGQGKFKVVKRHEVKELEDLRRNRVLPPAPGFLDRKNPRVYSDKSPSKQFAPKYPRSRSLRKAFRRDKKVTVLVPNPDERFLGWDVQMSPVTKGGPTPVRLFVSSGYDISNSITVGVAGQLWAAVNSVTRLVGGNIDYGRSWTTTQSQQFSVEVPNDTYGVFVINPWTNRKTGHIFEGVIGSNGTYGTYQADSFEDKSYENMEWVDGVVQVCTSKTFPVKRCLGEGTL